jgi:hypothetical protein
MSYIYYIDGEKFTTDFLKNIPFLKISSPDEETPAWCSALTGFREWYLKGKIMHRLTGPAKILSNGREEFWLNDEFYETIKEWITDHPNPDLYFNKIGVFTETDKVLWFLQN